MTAATALGLAGSMWAGGVAHAAAAPALVTLSNEVLHNLSSFTAEPGIDTTSTMQVGVGMVQDTAAIDSAYTALFTPGSPTYHDWYTPASFEAAFGVSQAAAELVHDYVTRDGLQVVYSSPDGGYLELKGTVAEVDSTFKLTEGIYKEADGTTFTASDVGPTVPSDVAAVSGLSSLTVAHTAAMAATNPEDCGTVPLQPVTVPGDDLCIGALTPSDVRSVYQVPSGDLGNGQKVAIFGEGALDETPPASNAKDMTEGSVITELRGFETLYGQDQVPVKEILIGDPQNSDADTSGDVEWDLDSQAITGMAPDLQELDFYFGDNLADPSITATYNAWAYDPNGPLTGNSSFGGSEQLEYLDGFLEDVPLQQADMEGRTMFASAGDVGGSCLPGANGVTNTGVPCVEYPASSPYVTAVGGTVLYTQANGDTEVQPAARALEYSWTYSGGGHSDYEPAPSWQPAAFPTGGNLLCTAANQTDVCRGVPDVSALSGDLVNGYAFYDDGGQSEEGGTSLASPLWAGAWANVQAAYTNTTCTDSSLVSSAPSPKYSGAGFAPQDLYAIAANTTADDNSFFNVGGTTDSVEGAGNGQQVSMPRTPVVDPTGYSFVAGLGTPMLSGIIGNIDCGNTAAVTTSTGEDGSVAHYTYGVDAPYNTASATNCGPNGVSDHAETPVPSTSTTGSTGSTGSAASTAYTLVSSDLTSDATSTTFSAVVSNATATAADDIDYAWEFTYGPGATTGDYAVTVDTGPDPSAELYSLAITNTATGLGVEATPTALASLTPPTIDTATNTISVTMPFSVFNSAVSPTPPYGTSGTHIDQISVYSNSGPATAALDADFNVDPVSEVDYFQCPYFITGSPSSALPEVPAPIVLPILAAMIGGAVALQRRRRHRQLAES